MATAITIPDIGTTVDHVKLVRWLKKEGDAIKRGDILCEVETDKAVSELESIAEGILLKTLAAENSEVQQGSVVAYVGKKGETVDAAAGKPEPKAAAPAAQPQARVAAPAKGAPPVAPVVRNLANRLGVDLAGLQGTGPGGRITREDVEQAAAGKPAAADKSATAAGQALSANQVVVARRVSRSQREIPPIALETRIDMTNVLRLRRGLEKKHGKKVCFDAFFVKAAATAMLEFPHFRCRMENERVIENDAVVIGVAVGVEQELFIPVVRGADTKELPELDDVIRKLADKAETGRFGTEDLTGATLTVSNLGMFPVRAFHAIIPPDQIAVLSVGATEETPIVRDGAAAIAPLASVVLTVDHRLINGREAAQFLSRVKGVLEA